MQISRLLLCATVVASATIFSACNPTLRSHGFRYPQGVLPEIQPGNDTQSSILKSMGAPSTIGTFEQDKWYYISVTREYLAYQKPDTRDRRVIEIEFNADGVVSSVNEYGMDEGRIVAFVERETPTRGRELSLLEQILGSGPGIPTDQFGGEQNLPGGAGGPRNDGL